MSNNYNTSLQNINTDLQEILNTIKDLPEVNNGIELPELTNEGSSSDLLSGKQLIDSEGNIVEGTIPTRTSSNLTASGATVTVPSGYYASQATKSIAIATQATPSIIVNSVGVITASATQTAGYVSDGTKSATKQLTTKAATTITPSTSSQTAVAANVYTTGAITVAAIPSKYKDVSSVTAGASDVLTGKKIVNSSGTVVTGTMANNGTMNKTFDGVNTKSVSIPAGYTTGGTVALDSTIDTEVNEQSGLISQIQSIVDTLPEAGGTVAAKLQDKTIKENGTYTADSGYDGLGTVTVDIEGGAVDHSMEDSLINGNYTAYTNERVTSVGAGTFAYHSRLTTVSFPKVTSIDYRAFYSCTSLTTASFPQATTIGNYAFYWCSNLTTASFPKATIIGSDAFYNCYNLTSLYLTASSVCKLSNSNVFTSTPIGGYSTSAGTYGSIFVPASLMDAYKSATNWTYFSSRFVGVATEQEEPDIGGGDSGELITFTLDGTEYSAEEGMTFRDWIASGYNTDGWQAGLPDVLAYPDIPAPYKNIPLTTIIENGGVY